MKYEPPMDNFNPRSPCGERLDLDAIEVDESGISTHAPRAGSDGNAADQLNIKR